MSFIQRAAALIFSAAIATAPVPSVPATAPVWTPVAATSATPVPKVLFNAPKIAVKRNTRITLNGTVKGVALNSGDEMKVRVYRYSGGKWHLRRNITPARKHLTSTSTTWTLSVKLGERGSYKAQAMLRAGNGRFTQAFSKPVRFRVVSAKYVALTFDDGPWPHSTKGVVDALKANDVQATFFEIGQQIKGRPDRTKLVFNSGNPVEVHTWHHDTLTKRSAKVNKADFRRCIAIIKKVTGVAPRWLRPPGGATNKAVKKTVKSAGLRQIIWTVDTLDWKNRNTSIIVKRTMKGVRPGGVVLMHDGGGPRQATVRAVPIVIRKLRAKGYDFVTLDELVALGYSPK